MWLAHSKHWMFAASNRSTSILEIGLRVMHRQEESETGKWVALWKAITIIQKQDSRGKGKNGHSERHREGKVDQSRY